MAFDNEQIIIIVKIIIFLICIAIFLKTKDNSHSLICLIVTTIITLTITDIRNYIDNSIYYIISSLNEPTTNIEQPLSDDYLDVLLGIDDPDDYLDNLLGINDPLPEIIISELTGNERLPDEIIDGLTGNDYK